MISHKFSSTYQSPSWPSGYRVSLQTRRLLDRIPLQSNFFSFLHIENAHRNCKSLDFDSIRFDTVDSIEISMYRPNLTRNTIILGEGRGN